MKDSNERIKDWLSSKKVNPIIAEFHLTNKCNLKCLSCWQRGVNVDTRKELPDKQWISVVNQAIDLGIEECYLGGGGEPMCRSNLVLNVMEKIKKKNIKGFMTTNCTLFDEKQIKELVKNEWGHLQVSIDGGNKETQDFLRGNGVFEKNVQVLKLFNKWKKRLNKEKPHISFHTVLSNKNYKELEGIIRLADELGVNEVNLQPLVVQSEYCKTFILDQKQEEGLLIELRDASKLANEKKIINNFESILKKGRKNLSDNKKIKCFEPWNRITILNDGKVKTCCNPSKVHESMHEKTLQQIWYGNKFNKIRKTFYEGKLMKECCTHPNKKL